MAIGMPSASSLMSHKLKWLPFLAKHLSLPITRPLGIGKPTIDYPYKWIDGETVRPNNINSHQFFLDLADF